MVLTDDVADDAGRFFVRLVVIVTQLAHGEQDTPVNRFQAIADIGQRAPDDNAHGVVEVRLPHLIFEIDGKDLLSRLGHSFNSNGWRQHRYSAPGQSIKK